MKNKKIMFVSILMLVIITVGLCGCTGIDSNLFVQYSGATLTIEGFNEPLKLLVKGEHNDITVSKNVVVRAIFIEGTDNIVRLSKTHINVTMDYNSDFGNKIVYYDKEV